MSMTYLERKEKVSELRKKLEFLRYDAKSSKLHTSLRILGYILLGGGGVNFVHMVIEGSTRAPWQYFLYLFMTLLGAFISYKELFRDKAIERSILETERELRELETDG